MTDFSRAFALLALSSLLLPGCGEQDATAPTPTEPVAYAIADTPDQLVENFARAHDEKNLQEYSRVLHEDFEFHYLPEAGSSAASSQARSEELSSADRVFRGRPGRDANGGELAPVSNIDFELQPFEPWQDLGGDRHRRVYQASMTVSHSDGSIREVAGLQQLTVARDGEEYRLVGWRDLGDL